MASSSKTKRPRTSGSKSKQWESSSKSNPLNLTRLLANDSQRKVFEEHFHGRQIFAPRYGISLERERSLLGERERVDTEGSSLEREPRIGLLERELDDFTLKLRPSNTFRNLGLYILSAGYLKLEERLLHYFLSYVILPKFSNHSQISDVELQLMYAIKYNIKINWTHMIIRQMWNVRGSQSLLPYAIFITKILEHFGVCLDGETKVAPNLRESKIYIEVVHKMGFTLDPFTHRTCRHRSDRPTTPTE
ncbi:hypothetical protein Lal_00031445 [Lupinus albus]|nr:hypothetical protein Lal_00031445 [Lupinus albus]